MKTPLAIAGCIVLFILFALRPPSSHAQQGVLTAFSQIVITNGHAVATNFASTNLKVMKATLIGLQAGGISNAAAVYVGPISNGQYYIIAPGERHIIETQPGSFIFLNSWWLRTPSAGDGLTVIYQ